MEAFELTEIFPLTTSDAERELGFEVIQISLAGFGMGDDGAIIKVSARQLNKSDILLKMNLDGQTYYRPIRHGYKLLFGLRMPWEKTKWHPLAVGLLDAPDFTLDGVKSDIVPEPFEAER